MDKIAEADAHQRDKRCFFGQNFHNAKKNIMQVVPHTFTLQAIPACTGSITALFSHLCVLVAAPNVGPSTGWVASLTHTPLIAHAVIAFFASLLGLNASFPRLRLLLLRNYLVHYCGLLRGGIPRRRFVNPKKLSFPSLCLTQSRNTTCAGTVGGTPSSLARSSIITTRLPSLSNIW